MKSLIIALSVEGGRPRKSNDPPPRAPRYRRCSGGCEVPPLGIGIQAMQLSPYRAGLAGRHLERLPVTPAFPTCSFPLRLSPSGQSDDPGASLRAPPDCIRDSTPRSAAYTFASSGSPVVHSWAAASPPGFLGGRPLWIAVWQEPQTTRVFRLRADMIFFHVGFSRRPGTSRSASFLT